MNRDNNNQFGILAKYYDIFNCSANYKKVADYIEKVFAAYNKKPGLVLDLACGTGNLTLELAKRGYDMTGLDLSPEMLSEAVQKSRANNNILWVNQDMCNFELYGTVDAIVCCFDSVNYILESENVKKCFALVYNYLNPGGIFVFDVNSKYKFESVYANNNFIIEKKYRGREVFCAWRNYYNKRNRTCDFDIDLFVSQPDGNYARYNETQREKYHSVGFLEKVLSDAGFADVKIFCDFECEEYKENGERENCGRVCFAAAKI